MKSEAEFLTSAFSVRGCPRWSRVEVALVGRSNVGKSSLLNALVGNRSLARTSKTPGRTQCLNFFTVGDELAVVDLPGYGYAKMPHERARTVATLMRDFLKRRENLAALLLLVDCRRDARSEERELAAMARGRGRELMVAATKSDKLRHAERRAALQRFRLLGVEPILCSAKSGEGLDELRRRIFRLTRPLNPSVKGMS